MQENDARNPIGTTPDQPPRPRTQNEAPDADFVLFPLYWEPKLVKNRERDAETTAMAEAEGWRVLRIWEHVPPEEAVQLVVRELEEPGSAAREREE